MKGEEDSEDSIKTITDRSDINKKTMVCYEVYFVLGIFFTAGLHI